MIYKIQEMKVQRMTRETINFKTKQVLAPKVRQQKLKLMMKQENEAKPVVCMTGFVNDENQENYKKMMQVLELRLTSTLSEETKILIVNNTSTQKFKIAKLSSFMIQCVTINWLIDSFNKQCLLPAQNYEIPKIFFGVKTKLFGFTSDKTNLIKNVLQQNGAEVSLVQDQKSLLTDQQPFDTIIVSKENHIRLKPYFDSFNFPIVFPEWIQYSLKNRMCQHPFDYASNQFQLQKKTANDHYFKMKKRLQSKLANLFKQTDILSGTIIHLHENVEGPIKDMLKKLVQAYGGFYLNEPSLMVTHILTEPLSQKEYNQLKNTQILTNILRVQWLIDSIYMNKKMKEDHYRIRSFRGNKIQQLLNNKVQTNPSTSSVGMHTADDFIQTMPNLRKSISMSISTKKNPKEIKTMKKYQSTIFKDYFFYIEGTQKKQTQLIDMPVRIVKNGGQIFTNRAVIKDKMFYYILKDSSENKVLIEQLKKDIKDRVKFQPVSYRWINDCLSKGQFFDIAKSQSFIYKPFNFKTPILGFHKMVFDTLGVDDNLKIRLKQLFNCLGSNRNYPNRSEITHCLCGQSFKQTKRYQEISKQNSTASYIWWKWLIDCVNYGKMVPIGQYIAIKNQNNNEQVQNSMSIPNMIREEQDQIHAR